MQFIDRTGDLSVPEGVYTAAPEATRETLIDVNAVYQTHTRRVSQGQRAAVAKSLAPVLKDLWQIRIPYGLVASRAAR